MTILTILAAATVLHLADVYGIGWGEGFASNEDVKDIRQAQLEERLEKYYTAICMIPPGQPTDEALLDLVRRLQQEYEKLTGHRYDVPNCDVLFKIRAAAA